MYEEVLTIVYGFYMETAYKGRGRKPLPKWGVHPQLKYAQVVKERKNDTIINISTRIVVGDEIEILKILENYDRSNSVSTSFVESRNGAFRKDDKPLD